MTNDATIAPPLERRDAPRLGHAAPLRKEIVLERGERRGGRWVTDACIVVPARASPAGPELKLRYRYVEPDGTERRIPFAAVVAPDELREVLRLAVEQGWLPREWLP